MTLRDRLVIVAVLVVGALVGTWLLVISPKRSEAGQLGTQVQSVQQRLDGVRAQLAHGQAAQGSFANDYSQLVRLGEAVPADDDVPSLIYQIQSAASAAHVDFRGLQLNSSSGPAAAAATTATGASSAPLPPGVTVGEAGFPVEQFTFTFRGNFFHLADFFNRLQRFVIANKSGLSIAGRLMSLNAITLGPAGDGFPTIAATVAATTYMLPSSQGLLNGATAAGPAQTAAAPSTAGASTSNSAPAAVVASPVR